MITKNTKFGKHKMYAIVELGEGDIGIAAIANKKVSGIAFNNLNCYKKIGATEEYEPPISTDNLHPQVILTFSKIESIEVLQKKLDEAKKHLQKINEYNEEDAYMKKMLNINTYS